MGEVISIFDPKDRSGPSVSDKAFYEAIESDETRLMTESAIGVLIRAGSFRLPDMKARILRPVIEPDEQGTCYIQKSRNSLTPLLLTDSRFPNFLVSRGISDAGAVKIASVYARGLDFIINAFSGNRTWHGEDKQAIRRALSVPTRAGIWHPEIMHSKEIVEFRVAGAIALEAVGFNLDVGDRASIAPHIAGLIDPLITPNAEHGGSNRGMLQLQEIITNTK